MSSYKNRLQEYFQKRQLPLPVYSTNIDQDNFWISEVVLHDGRRAIGKSTNKVGAEQNAAQEALKFIFKSIDGSDKNKLNTAQIIIKEKDVLTTATDPRKLFYTGKIIDTSIEDNDCLTFTRPTALLVDLENLPKIIDELPNINGLDIYAFVGEHHPLVDKVFTKLVKRIVSPSTRKDGTDTCMQVFTGMLLAQEKYELYIIATIDHYGSALVDMIKNNTVGWKGKEAKLITKPQQLKI